MGRELAKKAGLGAVETTLKALMPELFERLDKLESRLDDRFEAMEVRFEKRFERVDERFEKMTLELRDLRNEMLDKFESTLESRLDNLIERTGFLQGTMSQKRRKAG
jgi:chaperonin cofactor prefoldin